MEERRKKRGKKEEEEDRCVVDWQGLHEPLLELILDRLSPLDYVRFGDVCRSWKRVAADKQYPPSGGLPWLVLTSEDDNNNKNNGTRTCFSVLEKIFWKMKLPQARGMICWGSFHEWLIMVDSTKCRFNVSLLNPFSGEEIHLPEVRGLFDRAVLSSSPTDPDCKLVLASRLGRYVLWVRERGIWVVHAWISYPKDYTVQDLAFCNGRLYMVTSAYDLLVIDDIENTEFGEGGRFIVAGFYYMEMEMEPAEKPARPYLVESCGDLLLVVRVYRRFRDGRYRTIGFKVYRLDTSEMVWREVQELVDRVLLMGTCSTSLSASRLGCRGNRIYFSNDFGFHVAPHKKLITRAKTFEGWGFYSSEDKCIQHGVEFKQSKRDLMSSIWLTAPVEWCARPNPNLCRIKQMSI